MKFFGNMFDKRKTHENEWKTPEPETEKKSLDQICEKTGVSKDYLNKFCAVWSAFEVGGGNMVKGILGGKTFHMERYEDVYADYDNVVNEKNKEAIQKLDELAEKLNNILLNLDNINEEEFLETCNEMYFLIYGEERKKR